MGEERKVYKFIEGKPEGRWWGGVDSVGSEQGPVAGFCEHGNEPSDSGATELVSSLFHYKTFLFY
jgi:hypothetical protein